MCCLSGSGFEKCRSRICYHKKVGKTVAISNENLYAVYVHVASSC